MKRGFKKKANRLSKSARLKLDLKVEDYLDPRVLANAMGAKIIDPANLNIPSEALDTLLKHREDEWSALGAKINGVPTIFINSSHPPTRIEASIMHELAHFILEHEPMFT
jgi:Zn-dependent peptidase ImmA (M78 family)